MLWSITKYVILTFHCNFKFHLLTHSSPATLFGLHPFVWHNVTRLYVIRVHVYTRITTCIVEIPQQVSMTPLDNNAQLYELSTASLFMNSILLCVVANVTEHPTRSTITPSFTLFEFMTPLHLRSVTLSYRLLYIVQIPQQVSNLSTPAAVSASSSFKRNSFDI